MLDPVARMEIQEVHHHEGVCQRRRGYDVDGTLLFQGSRAAYTGKLKMENSASYYAGAVCRMEKASGR